MGNTLFENSARVDSDPHRRLRLLFFTKKILRPLQNTTKEYVNPTNQSTYLLKEYVCNHMAQLDFMRGT